eukprot:Hpha_TRINITY_DN16501_c2_g2::TRINITY_DN16501_c2_g2_i1::g.137187::m.137187/K18932/ZDHHC; palmitoyltransferase
MCRDAALWLRNRVILPVWQLVEPVFWFCSRLGMMMLGVFCVVLANILIVGLSVTWWHSILPILVDLSTPWGLAQLGFSVWCTFNICFNHFMAAGICPGRPQSSLLPSPAAAAPEDYHKRPGEQWARFCRRCLQWKPPRSHHCPFCGACVLKMDHHCPWINNCVGHFNQKWFVSMLLYIWLATGQIAISLALLWMGYIGDVSVYPFAARRALIHTEFSLCLALFVVMTGFLGWNGWLLVTNQTVIEFYGNRLAAREARACGRTYRNPFDLGMIGNIEAVYGSIGVLGIFLPTIRRAPSDGHSYSGAFGNVSLHAGTPADDYYESDSEMRLLPT